MEIDTFLADYDFCEKHRLIIHAPCDRVYKAFKKVDFTNSTLIRILIRLRGIRIKSHVNLMDNFTLLSEKPSEEIVWGLIGQPWTFGYGKQKIDAHEFQKFSKNGF